MFEGISSDVLVQIDVVDEVSSTWEGEGYYRFAYTDGPTTSPVWYEYKSELFEDYISALESEATETHLPTIEYIGDVTPDKDSWYEFCTSGTVRNNLIEILTSYVADWQSASKRVTSGIDSSWMARQQTLFQAAQVLGAANMVFAITGDTPEVLADEVPHLRDCILYVSNYK